MNHADRLFPELAPGVSLHGYLYRFGDGSISSDMTRAIAARRAGQVVRLWPKNIIAAYQLRGVLKSASRVQA